MNRLFVLSLTFLTLPMAALEAQQPVAAGEPSIERVALDPPSKGPFSLTFPDDVSLQEVFQDLGRQAGITVLFDEAFRDQTLALDLGEVLAEDALEKLTLVNRLFYKVLDPKTVIIIPDNAQKHRQYDEMLLHTFRVAHANVNGIANMFRTIAGIQRVEPDFAARSVTVRGSADQILVAQSILERNDQAGAEVAFLVEILAVNPAPDRAAGLAFDPEKLLRFKSEADAEALLSQSVRVTENERAKLSFEEGSRQPVEAPAGGQTSPGEALERRTVGIQLELQPQVNEDGNIRLSLTIRATARGESDPALVRSRELTTTASLKDRETTLVPALFRWEDFGGALDYGRGVAIPQRDVVIAIKASVLRPAPISEVLPPLPMGTEQLIRVPRP